mmetsp:Transcript_20626/g.62952  ORF Transcript_20626/g.62952 Transcript_20626/m.62952 type:complete len:259 (-) Transcript_20626:2381-3157(-)
MTKWRALVSRRHAREMDARKGVPRLALAWQPHNGWPAAVLPTVARSQRVARPARASRARRRPPLRPSKPPRPSPICGGDAATTSTVPMLQRPRWLSPRRRPLPHRHLRPRPRRLLCRPRRKRPRSRQTPRAVAVTSASGPPNELRRARCRPRRQRLRPIRKGRRAKRTRRPRRRTPRPRWAPRRLSLLQNPRLLRSNRTAHLRRAPRPENRIRSAAAVRTLRSHSSPTAALRPLAMLRRAQSRPPRSLAASTVARRAS